MKLRRNLLAFFLGVVLIMSMGVTTIAEEEVSEETNSKEIEVITALGIMSNYEDGTFQPENIVTRADFAQILSQLYDRTEADLQQEWNNEFYQDEDSESALKDPVDLSTKFSDVPNDFWAYHYIENVVNCGLMTGLSQTMFGPAEDLRYEDAVKALVRMLGYGINADILGGFPQGYLSQAGRIELTSGIDLKVGQSVTRNDLARIFYNALDIQILHPVAIGTKNEYHTYEDSTFLTEILQMGEVEGQMTSNDATSLTGASIVGRNHVVIDGESFKLAEGAEVYADNIGRYVKAYYLDDDSSVREIVYMQDSKRQNAITISSKNFNYYQNYEFSYFDEESGAERSERISPSAAVIYNGVAITNYNSDTFDFYQGDITLISNGSDSYDVVVVNDYQNFVVSGIDANNHIVYNRAVDKDSATNDVSIVLDENDSDLRIRITNTAGEKCSFEDIEVGDILSIAANGNYARVIICNDMKSKVLVEEVSAVGKGLEVVLGEENYVVSDYYLRSRDAVSISVGSVITIYLDAFGEIAWIDVEPDGTLMSACFVQVDSGQGIAQDLKVKLFNSLGVVQVFDVADKVKIAAVNSDIVNFDEDDAYALLANSSGSFIRYSVNAEMEINYIEFPATEATYAQQQRAYTIFETTSDTNDYPFKSNLRTFGGQAYINDNTVIFSVPEDTTDETNYYLLTVSGIRNESRYQFTAYATRPDTVMAEYMVIHNLKPSISESDSNYFVVSKITEAIGEDGERVKKVSGWAGSSSGATEATLYGDYSFTDANGAACTAFDLAYDIPTSRSTTYKVQPGDVIKCLSDPSTGYAKEVQIYFKADAPNPAAPDGAKGWLVGTTGKYDAQDAKSNPFIANQSFVPATGGRRFNGGNIRLIYGSVYMNDAGLITMTTQDLSSQSYVGSTDEWVVESYDANKFKMTAVNYGAKNIEVKAGTVSDIMSYKEVGESCSHVLVITSFGDPKYLIIMNGLSK